MQTIDNVLWYSFNLLSRTKESLQSPAYDQLLQRFQSLYSEFVEFWKEKEPGKASFRLMHDGNLNPQERTGIASAKSM